MKPRFVWVGVLLALFVAGLVVASTGGARSPKPCRGNHGCPTTTAPPTTTTVPPTTTAPTTTVPVTTTTTGSDPVIAAAGDACGDPTSCAPTANVIDQINPSALLTLGDNAYEDGTLSQYQTNYAPNWGRNNAKVFPAPGNHDFHTANAQGYRDYFGSRAPGLYYSFDLGAWHLISLASTAGVSPAAGGAEETWLKSDLAAHANQCVLAYWHEPRWSQGSVHGNDADLSAIWNDLYAAHADVVLNGHDHNYQRFGLLNPSGAADPNGIREFVVGTGGWGHYTFTSSSPIPQVENDTDYGVLKMTLHSGSYDWTFVSAGGTFTDAGTDSCH
jgi:acid phosphatase type 7